VSTVGGVMGMKQALAQLALLSAGSRKSYRLGVPMPPISMPMLENKAAKKLIKTSKAFYASMTKTKRHKPGFGDFAYFGAFKSMSQLDSYKEACPADFDYYKEKAAYFYPVQGVRSYFGKMLAGVMRLSFKLIVKDKADKEQTGVSEAK
jgi:hypothetical protein